jgi:hypothetical protein
LLMIFSFNKGGAVFWFAMSDHPAQHDTIMGARYGNNRRQTQTRVGYRFLLIRAKTSIRPGLFPCNQYRNFRTILNTNKLKLSKLLRSKHKIWRSVHSYITLLC